jgi:hypothetical protein
MALSSGFNPELMAQQMAEAFYNRLLQAGLTDVEAQSGAITAQQFAQIAGQLLSQEPNYTLPGTETAVTFDDRMATQSIELFLEGLYHACLKCWEYGISGEIKNTLLQQLAMNLFEQGKQVVATTVGQELTPELQFPPEQLNEWMKQGSESGLLYYINELEKQYGPIQSLIDQQNAAQQPQQPEPPPPPAPAPPPPPAEPDPPANESLWDDEEDEIDSDEGDWSEQPDPLMLPELPPEPAPQLPATIPPALPEVAAAAPPERQSRERSPGAEKYAAVALFLSALSRSKQAVLLDQFSPDEKTLIRYYMDPDNISNDFLDVDRVERYLLSFKQRLERQTLDGRPKLTPAMRSIRRLAARGSTSRLMGLLQPERQRVQKFVSQCLHADNSLVAAGQVIQLPPRLEAALCEYLTRQLDGGAV